MRRQLMAADYRNAASELGCEVAALRAVAEVEAPGGGFLQDGRIRVLFEGHVFHRETKGVFHGEHPTLSYPKWTRQHYARGKDAEERGAGELARLAAAIKLNRTAALRSASYGKFQLMGFNHRACLHPDLEEFYNAMRRDEQAQLDAFCHFLRSMGLVVALRQRNWTRFASKYNGPRYAENEYHIKLAWAYRKFASKKVAA